ncbi:protein phosphatase 2C domain-containing protein [Dolichospermum compactum]|uniref:Protein-serine/threonine phosphatase n=1 Tax=Dolichospermum compactum NIES-806 TaxID=1973481 RepID=A0A1Z4V1W3_9CYAN|nr:protein phosphatase 2C domain-containing protein [Dolichospermum compactum]BAZ85512.1 protein-serine/threonine phosphatase [Dolichospermum compactum NIES-806]
MFSTQRVINCPNPECDQPLNAVGETICDRCYTPLIYRYLWATGKQAAEIPPETKVANRYEVIKPQIWLDTQPALLPDIPAELPNIVIPYLRLYSEHLHIPQAYGFTSLAEIEDDILLLENAPIDETGCIYPTITDSWKQASPVRQIYWLWQILQLWTPLSALELAQSLLLADNLCVQGWCIRLLELHQNTGQPTLQDLGNSWRNWVTLTETTLSQKLDIIVELMCQPENDLEIINTKINEILLTTAAELPLYLTISGATDSGSVIKHNEDACYPIHQRDIDDQLQPRLAIICDGIGGHEGGEVASQLALQSLKLQMRALLAEIDEQTELLTPNLLCQQIESCLRVVNNVVWSRNDEQKRQGKERMATTLVMSLQIPQKREQLENSHELYLAHVGDSRAYWITQNYCQLLTVDDDMVKREVGLGKSLYRQALQIPEAKALTQALGTKEAEFLNFSVQRFIIEEDGILLLCSDGLSDRNLVEQSWQDYAIPVLTGDLDIADATQELIKLANEKNGQDNISVILTLCRVAKPASMAIIPAPPAEIIPPQPLAVPDAEALIITDPIETDLTASSQALLDLSLTEEPTAPLKPSKGKGLVLLAGLLVLLLGSTTVSLFAWWQLSPQSFSQICRQLPQKVRELCPGRE